MMRNKIVIDAAVPYISGVLEPWFDVEYLPARQIDAAAVKDASALIIRTRTKCNAALLDGSAVRIIATATIGMDHIDLPWCAGAGITAVNAPGCNADGVMEWVFAALAHLPFGRPLQGMTLGVVGVGEVGGRVADMGRRRGFRVLENDPPKQAAGVRRPFVSLESLLEQSDIVTLHIPLGRENFHFADARFFARLKRGAAFLNAARGGVADEAALLSMRGRLGPLAIDVWEGEPDINPLVLASADIATPHIAGYTAAGKVNATVAAVRSIANYFGISELLQFEIKHSFRPYNIEGYDILADDRRLREHPSDFELLRTHYNLRG